MHAQDHHRGLSAGGYSYGLKGANTGVGPKWVHHSWVMDTLCYVIASLYTRRGNGHAGAQTHCRQRPSIGLYAVVVWIHKGLTTSGNVLLRVHYDKTVVDDTLYYTRCALKAHEW